MPATPCCCCFAADACLPGAAELATTGATPPAWCAPTPTRLADARRALAALALGAAAAMPAAVDALLHVASPAALLVLLRDTDIALPPGAAAAAEAPGSAAAARGTDTALPAPAAAGRCPEAEPWRPVGLLLLAPAAGACAGNLLLPPRMLLRPAALLLRGAPAAAWWWCEAAADGRPEAGRAFTAAAPSPSAWGGAAAPRDLRASEHRWPMDALSVVDTAVVEHAMRVCLWDWHPIGLRGQSVVTTGHIAPTWWAAGSWAAPWRRRPPPRPPTRAGVGRQPLLRLQAPGPFASMLPSWKPPARQRAIGCSRRSDGEQAVGVFFGVFCVGGQGQTLCWMC